MSLSISCMEKWLTINVLLHGIGISKECIVLRVVEIYNYHLLPISIYIEDITNNTHKMVLTITEHNNSQIQQIK